MRRAVRTQQVVAPRTRDIDTGAKFAGSLILSALAHTVALSAVMVGSWLADDEKSVKVGYKVELISLNPSKKAERSQPLKPAPAPKPVAQPNPTKPQKVEAAPKITPLKSQAPKPVTKPKPTKPEKVEAAESLTPVRPVEPASPIRPPVLPTAAPVSRPIPSAPTGGAASMVQGEETAYSYYMQIVNDKVRQNWITLGIDITGKRANPVVRFDIDRGGSVLNPRLDKTSGAPALDESALEAIRTLALPPLPSEYPTDLMRIRFTFDYEQNQR